jgi:hypothetical protein
MYKFIELDLTYSGLKEISDLVNFSSGNNALSPDYLRWQYLENPLGKVFGFNATYNNQLVAHYATIPVRAVIHGNTANGLLSVNTATHPLHTGKGLFIKLASMTYELGSGQGYSYVVGVANKNSINGFINKLGFQFLGRLQTRFTTSTIHYFERKTSLDFLPINDSLNLAWRLSKPNSDYYNLNKKERALIIGKSRNFQVMLYEGDNYEVLLSKSELPLLYRVNPVKMWLGLDSHVDWKRTLNLQVSDHYKATTLNLIFLDLKSWGKIDNEMLSFWSIDFDSY